MLHGRAFQSTQGIIVLELYLCDVLVDWTYANSRCIEHAEAELLQRWPHVSSVNFLEVENEASHSN